MTERTLPLGLRQVPAPASLVWAIWEDTWAQQAEMIRDELSFLLRAPVAEIEALDPEVMEPPPDPNEEHYYDLAAGQIGAVGMLPGWLVGRKLAVLLARWFSPRPTDERHPFWHDALAPLALALARRMRMRTREREALRVLADGPGPAMLKRAKEDLVACSLLAVVSTCTKAQRVRVFGRTYRSTRPLLDLTAREFVRWLVSAVDREVRAQLRSRREGRLESPEAGEVPEARAAMAESSAAARAEVEEDDVARVYAAARDDADRRLLDALSEHGKIGPAAQAIGMKAGAARQRIVRLRKRIASNAVTL